MRSRVAAKHWDFEFGLLSVSLDPAAWLARSSTRESEVFLFEGPLKLLDVDKGLEHCAEDISRHGQAHGFLAADGMATERLYTALNVTPYSATGTADRSVADWTLQMCLAVLASQDTSIHGLWWSDSQGGAFPSERGGLYQYMLSAIRVRTAALPTTVPPSPPAHWEAAAWFCGAQGCIGQTH